MIAFLSALALLALCVGHSGAAKAGCPDYSDYSKTNHTTLSNGRFKLSFMRPDPDCRISGSSEVDDLVTGMQDAISDPDLYRLFENTFPNTFDTAVRWYGHAANNSDEELTFIITGDINAMWLRDSTNQLLSYTKLLHPHSPTSWPALNSLFRGAINLQARYVLTAPFCNSFQPPAEALFNAAPNSGASKDKVSPSYDTSLVWECKYELDSLAAFLTLSATYANATGDYAFFGRFQWLSALQAILNTANEMMTSTYAADGSVNPSPYSFVRETTRATETLANDGIGSPVANGTKLVRSAFRPSDDACVFQFLIPANMMFAVGLERCATIVEKLEQLAGDDDGDGREDLRGLRGAMEAMASGIRQGINEHGLVGDPKTGQRVIAYEVDGFGSALIMDDANIPSLLSAPMLGYVAQNDSIYQNTRAMILDETGVNGNPYLMRGPVFSAVGGPHNGPGKAWPMASIVRILTSDDDAEITGELRQLLASTDGLGLMHESINSFNQSDYTRQWFSWANGLFGQMILDLQSRKPGLLKQSYQ